MKTGFEEPVQISRPSELQQLITGKDHPPLLATGTGSLLGRGTAPGGPVLPVDLTGLDRIVEHAHEDLTVTVEPGVRFQTLDRALAERNQWLPLDPFPENRGTVGGLIAADRRGPLAGGMGSIRDFLIGVRFVDSKGSVVSAGGRVVKNVAGYDLMKLMIGSLGQLGIVVEATLRLLPRPECWSAVEIKNPDLSLVKTSQSNLAGEVAPRGLWRVRAQGLERLLAVFAGAGKQVESQVNQVRKSWGKNATVLNDTEVQTEIRELYRRTVPREHPVGWGGALPSFLAREDLEDLLGGGDGILDLLRGHLWWFPSDDSLESVAGIRQELQRGAGHLHLDLPAPVKIPIEQWGRDPGAELSLWRKLKSAADPTGRLVSGRLAGGV